MKRSFLFFPWSLLTFYLRWLLVVKFGSVGGGILAC